MATIPEIDLPEYPLFDVSDIEAEMGADGHRYAGPRGWDAAKGPCNEISRALRAETDAYHAIFYSGKSLEEAGYRVRSDLDETKVQRAFSALLRSWDVSEQQKCGTMALAIHRWCEPIPAPVDTLPKGQDGEAG